MEIYREINTSTTKNSGRITIAWIVMEDNLEIPDRSGHRGVWETKMQLTEKNVMCGSTTCRICPTYRLNSMLGDQINIFYEGNAPPEKSLNVLMLMSPGPGWFSGSRRRSPG